MWLSAFGNMHRKILFLLRLSIAMAMLALFLEEATLGDDWANTLFVLRVAVLGFGVTFVVLSYYVARPHRVVIKPAQWTKLELSESPARGALLT